jgi:hypothetical protein
MIFDSVHPFLCKGSLEPLIEDHFKLMRIYKLVNQDIFLNIFYTSYFHLFSFFINKDWEKAVKKTICQPRQPTSDNLWEAFRQREKMDPEVLW